MASPYPLDGGSGNAVTALRIASWLDSARASHGWDDQPAEVMIALHAHRSRAEVERFRTQTPGGRVAVLLTGTDLHEFPVGELVEVGEAADALVVMHEAARRALPARLVDKALVIHPSVALPVLEKSTEAGLVTQLGHLRPVKNPFLAVESLQDCPIRLLHLGQALSVEMEEQASGWMSKEPRYTWLDNLDRDGALRYLAKSHFTLNTSRSEGASNAVLESVALGVPVLASRIPGNVGLLGDDYQGLFGVGELPGLMRRATEDAPWLESLRAQLALREPLFRPETEQEAWRSLVDGLCS